MSDDVTHKPLIPIRISKYPGVWPLGGVKIEVDGQELKEVRSARLTMEAMEPTLLEVETMAVGDLDITVNADVKIRMSLLMDDDYYIERRDISPGLVNYLKRHKNHQAYRAELIDKLDSLVLPPVATSQTREIVADIVKLLATMRVL